MEKMALADKIRDLRKRAKMSQEDLAERAGVARGVIQQIEAGNANPTLETMYALAQALGTTLDALTGQPQYAKAQVAEKMAAQERLLKNWVEAAEVLNAIGRAKPVRRLAGLYILTRNEAYLDALRELLPPQSQLLQALRLFP